MLKGGRMANNIPEVSADLGQVIARSQNLCFAAESNKIPRTAPNLTMSWPWRYKNALSRISTGSSDKRCADMRMRGGHKRLNAHSTIVIPSAHPQQPPPQRRYRKRQN